MAEPKRSIISESTLIPVSLVVALSGAIYWLSGLQYATAQNHDQIQEILESETRLRTMVEESTEKHMALLSRIDSQVAALDAKIQILVRYTKYSDQEK